MKNRSRVYLITLYRRIYSIYAPRFIERTRAVVITLFIKRDNSAHPLALQPQFSIKKKRNHDSSELFQIIITSCTPI